MGDHVHYQNHWTRTCFPESQQCLDPCSRCDGATLHERVVSKGRGTKVRLTALRLHLAPVLAWLSLRWDVVIGRAVTFSMYRSLLGWLYQSLLVPNSIQVRLQSKISASKVLVRTCRRRNRKFQSHESRPLLKRSVIETAPQFNG